LYLPACLPSVVCCLSVCRLLLLAVMHGVIETNKTTLLYNLYYVK
jgi:hypothetical protein